MNYWVMISCHRINMFRYFRILCHMSYLINSYLVSTIMCFFTSYRIIFHPCIHNQTTSCQIASHHVNVNLPNMYFTQLKLPEISKQHLHLLTQQNPVTISIIMGRVPSASHNEPPVHRSVTVLPRFFTKAVVPSPVEEHSALALAAKSSVVAWGNLGVDQPESLRVSWKTHREDDFPPWNWKNRYRKKDAMCFCSRSYMDSKAHHFGYLC